MVRKEPALPALFICAIPVPAGSTMFGRQLADNRILRLRWKPTCRYALMTCSTYARCSPTKSGRCRRR
ncbi:hypothetical protein C9397_15355 [Xanthomonas vasicola pv. vasculorum]|nr:hypothetical protein B1H41_09500 [Xanthomonas vasicola pv. vasculorum]TWQ09866.1 hypothetical protein FQK02_14820 [Xanthomonas vasicola]PDM36164.1 hypothetical protein CQW50_00790 [Xanthomonas vasicola pv. vasculorum]PUE70731.1 hypothetical protein C7Y63_05370 [Xanthomonas vasicola pv. vasculorum]PUE74764.1 hypothetical protein C7Y61_05345 [Xanthomonas vasicola pv. vasculorum]